MNETVEILFYALMERDAFSTPEIETAWCEIVACVKSEYQIQDTVSDKIWDLWCETSKCAFQLGLKAAADIQQPADMTHLRQN